jgi:hypothetical protein
MCAGNARYRRGDPDTLRRSSLDTVDGDRPTARAISRTPSSRSRRHAISSRSSNLSLAPAISYLPQSPESPEHQIIARCCNRFWTLRCVKTTIMVAG